MTQTKLVSLIEVICNVASGFIVSLLMWTFVVPPMFGIKSSTSTGLGVTALFTVTSVIRGYIWRRLFNHRHRKV